MEKKEYMVDLKGVRSAKTLHRKLAEVLPFPSDYGHNYDAFFDFLTEFGTTLKIVFRHAKSVPAAFRNVCADAVAETPGLEIEFS